MPASLLSGACEPVSDPSVGVSFPPALALKRRFLAFLALFGFLASSAAMITACDSSSASEPSEGLSCSPASSASKMALHSEEVRRPAERPNSSSDSGGRFDCPISPESLGLLSSPESSSFPHHHLRDHTELQT